MKKNNTQIIPDYYASARLITELITLEDELRKIRYLSPFAKAPSIAHQIIGVIIISLALNNIIKNNKVRLDTSSILGLTLWHDAPEARYGDIGRDQRKYIIINEEKARADMFGSVSYGLEIIELIEKFEAGGTDASIKTAKDADALYVIYTIKDLLEKGIIINQPEKRIERTLKRMTTEEGFTLGQEMANKSPNAIWKLIKNYAGIKSSFTPSESHATILAIAWMLVELTKNKRIKRQNVLSVILNIDKNSANNEERKIANDATVIYEIAVAKRDVLKGNKKSVQFSRITKKLRTKEGKKLGDTLTEIDLYDWWNILMGYVIVNPDGSLSDKLR